MKYVYKKAFGIYLALFLGFNCLGSLAQEIHQNELLKEIVSLSSSDSSRTGGIQELLNETSSQTSPQSSSDSSGFATPPSSKSSSEDHYNNFLEITMPALHSALENSYAKEEIAQLSRSSNSFINSKRTLFFQAIKLNYKPVIQELIKNGQNVNDVDADGSMALHTAVQQGDKEVVKWLIDAGADINAVDTYYKRNALYRAVLNHNTPVVELLLKSGSHSLAPDGIHYLEEVVGTTAQKVALAEIFLAYTKIPDELSQVTYIKQAQQRSNDLIAALYQGNFIKARLMIQAGYYCSDMIKNTIASFYGLFYQALDKDDVEKVAFCYEKGISLIIKDSQGNTALHRAVKYRRLNVIDYLLRLGAPVTVKNHAGKTPIDLIIDNRREIDHAVLKLFLQYAYEDNTLVQLSHDHVLTLTLPDSDSDSDVSKKCCCVPCDTTSSDSSDSDSDTRKSACIIE